MENYQAILFIPLVYLSICSGCLPTVSTSERTIEEIRLEEGSLKGYDRIVIDKNRNCTYRYSKLENALDGNYKIILYSGTVRISEHAMNSLIERIYAIRYFELPDSYSSPFDVKDGIVWTFSVKTTDTQKTIHCNNSMPRSLNELKTYLYEYIIRPNMAEIEANAKRVTPDMCAGSP